MLKRFRRNIVNYIYDTTINIKERTFVVFSVSVLFALFAAIPTGLLMGEPLSATLSTVAGTVFFTAYVTISFLRNHIARAKIAISLILIFIFLPAMFFTNGGVEGGTPIWLLLGTIYIAMILEGRFKVVMMFCEAVVIIVSWIIGYLFPDIITIYSRKGNYIDTITGLFIVSAVLYTMIAFQNSLFRKEEEHKNVQRLFAQTATALVNAIDAKDRYTHGHSARVAEYSRRIAEEAGMDPFECEQIYYVALLHDVGKIGVPEAIINKEGKLTDEEFKRIKQHSEMGAQILQSITEYPFLSIGAHFHHERYDGKGYPSGLKGDDIPEIARIVAVADAYDAMTSKRSYRDPLPHDKVREEFIEGAGVQFDPKFANIMLHLIDLDEEYEMKERLELRDLSDKDALMIGEYRDDVSEGIVITPKMTTIEFDVTVDKRGAGHQPRPALILFDSLDGRFHDNDYEMRTLMYYEYGTIFFDGQVENKGVRKTKTEKLGAAADDSYGENGLTGHFKIEAVKVKDHAMISIFSSDATVEVTVALPDSSRYVYIGLTGEHCCIRKVNIEKAEEAVENGYIPRIAEEISFINVPAGDIPNVQADGYRSESTAGIPIRDGLKITFHTMSLPTARLVWHCPSYVIYSSDDGRVYGPNYREFSLVRIDGETWEAGDAADNDLQVDRVDFAGWDAWREFNRNGYDCTVTFRREGKKIISRTSNFNISIRDTVEVKTDPEEIYVAFSGDQVALTNIRISSEPAENKENKEE